MTETRHAIKVGRMHLSVSYDGLKPPEIAQIGDLVDRKFHQIAERTGIVDSSKAAALTAFEFAAELYNLRQRTEDTGEADAKKIDEISAGLERALAGGG